MYTLNGHLGKAVFGVTTHQEEMTKDISGKHLLQAIRSDCVFLRQETLTCSKHVDCLSVN